MYVSWLFWHSETSSFTVLRTLGRDGDQGSPVRQPVGLLAMAAPGLLPLRHGLVAEVKVRPLDGIRTRQARRKGQIRPETGGLAYFYSTYTIRMSVLIPTPKPGITP